MSQRLFEGKVAVVTGASSGIGREMAIQLAQKGAYPILIARSKSKLESLKKEIISQYQSEADYYILDVSILEDVSKVFNMIIKKYQRIDILINNAGYGTFDYLLDSSMESTKKMFNVNVFGLMACSQSVIPYMIKQKEGHIVNIASIAGKVATPKSTAYAASKHAVLGFTNAMRMELKGTGINVTAINPGPIRTPFFRTADPSGEYVKNIERYLLEPAEVAHQVILAIEKRKREVNMPRLLALGTWLYQCFPGISEKFAGKLLSKK
ncbi:SDR family NAD(P)-dependent oxidoreductase [Terrilactibacillus sp. BCM23-1]|uniref:SDR family NAD(P)-dependent oxidoreductase n=1 Tax=Terrilactibacillus tamarindi TaxID=2599694 RepID=A0A6N8CSW0_9BACI|nr:SDR family oxidoreductase [Terrilactibacillus tamarindi]MTT33234.1 SDR family NAD(P)-dependent oxidoreductase [Terrilactibacillus tamarindi]